MGRKNIIFIVALVAMVLGYTYYEANRPRPVDWTESFSREDKIPYGTYIAYRSLPHLFPGASVTTVRKPLAEHLQEYDDELTTYVCIASNFVPDDIETEMLLDFVGQGNDFFIVASRYSRDFLSELKLKWRPEFSDSSVRHTLSYSEDVKYQFKKTWYDYFELEEGFEGRVLGRAGIAQRPDFVRIDRGNGRIYLNLNPLAFTNYFLLDSLNGDYYNKVLSYLPVGRNVVWDDYPALGRKDNSSPFRVILKQPALRQAFYLLLFGALLYLLFCSRREQRPIPVIRPPQNKTLEFVAAVSSLFYKQKDHKAIATRRIRVFLEDVRHRYRITTEGLDARFIHMLSSRSGVEEGKVAYLVEKMVAVERTRAVSAEQLRQMVKLMELFK